MEARSPDDDGPRNTELADDGRRMFRDLCREACTLEFGSPAWSMMSLSAIGTPASGPGSFPSVMSLSMPSALVIAPDRSMRVKALKLIVRVKGSLDCGTDNVDGFQPARSHLFRGLGCLYHGWIISAGLTG